MAADPGFAIHASAFDAADFLLEQPRADPALGHGLLRQWRARGTPYLLRHQVEADGRAIMCVQQERRDWRPSP